MTTIDRTTDIWTKVAATAAVAGGGCWMAKQGVIAATMPPGGGPPAESIPIAVLYLSGVVLMAAGASGLVARLTAGRPMVLRGAAAVVVSPVVFWGLYTLIDMIVDGIAGQDAGWWWPGEGAVLITGVLFAAAGAAALSRGVRSSVPA